MSVGLRAIASHAYPGLDEVYVCAYSREEKDAVCDALDALGNEAAPSEDADRRYAERLRAELDEERARERRHPSRFAASGGLDLDHLGAEVG